MSNVIDLEAKRREKGPHGVGPFICLGCRHEWTGVVSLPQKQWVDCPSCGLEKGTAQGPFLYDNAHYACSCGNSLWLVASHGVYCPMCGGTADWNSIYGSSP